MCDRDANAGSGGFKDREASADAVYGNAQGWQHFIGRAFVPSYTSQLDMYRGGARNLHLHFGVSKTGWDDWLNYCAVFHELTDFREALLDRPSVGTGTVERFGKATSNDSQDLVLIGVVNSANDRDDVALRIGKVVGLRVFDDCPFAGAESLDGLSVSAPGFRVTQEVASAFLGPNVLGNDGPIRALSLLTRSTESHNDVIEGASQIVYAVANDGGDHFIRLAGEMEGELPDVLIACGLGDSESFIRVAFVVLPDCFLNFYHVLLCPLEFDPPRISHEVSSE